MEEKFLEELRFNELCKDALYHYLDPEGICPCCGEAILIKGYICCRTRLKNRKVMTLEDVEKKISILTNELKSLDKEKERLKR